MAKAKSAFRPRSNIKSTGTQAKRKGKAGGKKGNAWRRYTSGGLEPAPF